MICKKCGSNQPDDAKFCSNCGGIIEVENEIYPEEPIINGQPIEEPDKKEQAPKMQTDSDTERRKEVNIAFRDSESPEKSTTSDKIKEKVKSFWDGLDLFCKIETIVMIVFALLLFIALLKAKIFPIVFSVLQLGGLIVALLLHKGHIKCNLNRLKYIVLAAAIIFTGLYFSSYSWLDEATASIFDFSKSTTPYSAQECVRKDKDTVEDDFSTVGFYNIEQEPIEDLEIADKDNYGKVDTVSINGVTDFKGNKDFKSSSKVVIKYRAFKKISVPLSSEEIKTMDVESVLKAFDDAGFFEFSTEEKYDLDPDETTVEFENIISIDGTPDFEKGDQFSPNADIVFVTHRPYKKYNLKLTIDFVPNLIFSQYDVEFEIDDHMEKLTHGKDAEFEYRLKQGNYTLTFTSSESSSVNGSVELELNGDTEACYKISCTSEKVDVETQYIENRGDVVTQNTEVNITHQIKEDELKQKAFENETEETANADNEKVNYSTNTKSTVKNGNAGKYSYKMSGSKNAAGGWYDIYYIIDFDDGYVYYFCEGYGSEKDIHNTCDKIKIVSGDLNDLLIITYHDGSYTWSEGLHFKWKNQPDHLIMQDNDGFEYDFYATNLNEALTLRNKKTINNY